MLNKFASFFSGWRWLVIGFLVSSLILVGVNGVVMLLRASPDDQTEPVPGRLLYTTSFDTRQDYDWSLGMVETQANVADGALRLTADATTPYYSVMLRRDFTDIDVRINVKWLTDTQGFIGVRFRQDGRGDEASYYEMQLDRRGAYRITMVRTGHMPQVLSDWQIAPFAFTGKDQVNQVRIVIKTYVFAFYLNDQPLPLCVRGQEAAPAWTGIDTGVCSTDGQRTRTELVEQTLNGGMFGLGIYSDQESFSAAFDNLLIYGPR